MTAPQPVFASAMKDDVSGEIILKVVNASERPFEAEIELSESAQGHWRGREIVPSGGEPAAQNTLARPLEIVPKETGFAVEGRSFRRTFLPCSLTVIKLS